jgi:hypothetical protein
MACIAVWAFVSIEDRMRFLAVSLLVATSGRRRGCRGLTLPHPAAKARSRQFRTVTQLLQRELPISCSLGDANSFFARHQCVYDDLLIVVGAG